MWDLMLKRCQTGHMGSARGSDLGKWASREEGEAL